MAKHFLHWHLAGIFLLGLLFVLFFLAFQPSIGENRETVLKEVGSLVELNARRNLSSSDLSHLRSLVSQSEAAVQELREVEFFVLHGERKHVDHALPLVYNAFAGEVVPCPLDDLAHVSVYVRYNEIQLALESLEEAHQQWPAWVEKVQNARKLGPGVYPLFEVTLEKATRVFSVANLAIVDKELSYIEENGFC